MERREGSFSMFPENYDLRKFYANDCMTGVRGKILVGHNVPTMQPLLFHLRNMLSQPVTQDKTTEETSSKEDFPTEILF